MVEQKMAEEKKTGGGVVKVEPNPKNGVISKILDSIERVVVWAVYDSSTPSHYLSGNFAPVPEETPPCTDLVVRGNLP
ncbi:hypothetical protein AMTR_s00103p00163140, partial [Amborella trichopoda]